MNNNDIEDVEDIEELVAEEEPEPNTENSSLWINKVAYNAALTIVDAGTGWLIWQLTTYWYYGLIWFLAGAVVFFLHQKNYFTPGINEKQMKSSGTGIVVSVVSIALMAMVAGVLYVVGIRTQTADGLRESQTCSKQKHAAEHPPLSPLHPTSRGLSRLLFYIPAGLFAEVPK